MFIEGRGSLVALRQEGHVDPREPTSSTNITLLTKGGNVLYFSINIALLTEGGNASHLVL